VPDGPCPIGAVSWATGGACLLDGSLCAGHVDVTSTWGPGGGSAGWRATSIRHGLSKSPSWSGIGSKSGGAVKAPSRS